MGLESSDTIAGLDSSFPLSSDVRRNGDDHLRLIKNVLKKSFPGESGVGFSTVIQATEQEINYLVGVRSGIQAQIDGLTGDVEGSVGDLRAPVGTRLLFHQSVMPPGWVADLNFHHRNVITSSNSGGEIAGTDNPLTWTHQHGTQAHALNTGEIPGHIHAMWSHNAGAGGTLTWDSGEVVQASFHPTDVDNPGSYDNGYSGYSGGGLPHEHGNTLSATWTPLVTSVMIGVKT
jgi:hypothetical protein